MQALILAGGSGTRFWPSSRKARPKQLLALDGDMSLLEATVDRLGPTIGADRIWVCTTSALADAVRDQLPQVDPARILVEPEGRDTAPAIGWSVSAMTSMQPSVRGDAVVVLPADHRIAQGSAFRAALEAASRVAEAQDRILALGVIPRWAETGYGYLELGEALDGAKGATDLRRVQRFREKPDLETARSFLESGNYLWNAGIFVFRPEVFLTRLREHLPELGTGLDRIASEPSRLAEFYAELPKISIDFGLMEKLDDIGTLPLDCGWDDLGSWGALAEVLPADDKGNVQRGDVLAIDAKDNLLVADEGTIAVVGVEGLVVVRTGDSVLVMPRERSQEVRRVVDALREAGRADRL